MACYLCGCGVKRNKHILQDYSPEIDKTLTIYCFQPASGYCACVLIPS